MRTHLQLMAPRLVLCALCMIGCEGRQAPAAAPAPQTPHAEEPAPAVASAPAAAEAPRPAPADDGPAHAVIAQPPAASAEPERKPTQVRKGAKAPHPVRAARAAAASAQAAPELSDQAVADRIAAEAATAEQAERWQQAVTLAKRALAIAPDHVPARELLVLAERELGDEQRYARFSKLADSGDLAQAIGGYREIDEASRYHERGAKRFREVEKEFVAAFDQRAKALADAKDCVELARITRGVADTSIEAADVARTRYEAACAGPATADPEKVKTGDDVIFPWKATEIASPLHLEVLEWLARRVRSGTDVLSLEVVVTAVFEDADTKKARGAIARARAKWLKQKLVGLGVDESRIRVRKTVFDQPRETEGTGSASFWLVKRGADEGAEP